MGNVYHARAAKLSPTSPDVITVTEANGVYTVAQRWGENVFPITEYTSAEKAAARVLQLMGITEPVAPQTHAESIEITRSE